MNFLRSAALAALAGASALFTNGFAQQPGDLVLSASGLKSGVYFSDFDAGSLTTLSTVATQAVRTYENAIMFASGGPTPRLMSTDGQSTMIWANLLPGTTPTGIERDQDGNFLVSSGSRRLYRVGKNQIQLLKTFNVGLNGIARDLDTGDYVVVSASDGRVFQSDRSSTAYTTMRNLGSVSSTSITDMPGDYFAIGSRQTNGLFIGKMTGGGVQLPVPHVNAVCGEHETDTVWAATTAGQVYKLRGGVIVDTKSYGGAFAFTGIDVFGKEKVAITKQAGNAKVEVGLTFLRSPSRTYCVALSLAIRPGIPFAGNQRVNLQADDLFFLTACKNIPGLTKDFIGTTDASGRAVAEVTIPGGVPAFNVYVSAAAVNPSLPGGLELANTAVVAIPASGP